ncbi:MAG: HDOD domain-containing protein [Gammaproteobacteria bacterium]|nr:HDOD domain-containing protein [Gammaproteobacteria bacterium]MCP4980498.1 HDOD domain-containing protein [Gammaproteobacteria bacterium]
MKAAREFVSDIAEQLSMPEVYIAIRELLLNSNSTIEDFVEVVERDSMLAVRVMRVAKSPYFGFPRNCESLYQAISLIGLMQLHDLMLGSLCMRTFSAVPEQVLNLKAFWRYCVQCGIAARTIGQHSKTSGHHFFFTLGLLHEIGHAAMFLKAHQASIEALDISQQRNQDLASVERENFGFDYCELGAELMQIWHLPPVYQQVASFHLNPEHADEAFRSAVDVVHLAHAICQDLRPAEQQELISECIEQKPIFKKLPTDIDALVIDEIETNTDSVLGLLWPQGAQDLRSQPAGSFNA